MAFDVVRREHGGLRVGVRVNWGGIFCGAFMTVALMSLAVFFGNAIGLISWKLFIPNDSSAAVKVLRWIYTFLSVSLSFGIGGFFGTRVGGIEADEPAVFHALGGWAVSGVFLTFCGIILSAPFRQTLEGNGSNGASWLLLSIGFFGALSAAFGGMNSTSGLTIVSSEEMEEKEIGSRRDSA